MEDVAFSGRIFFVFNNPKCSITVTIELYLKRNFLPVCQEGALNCGKRVDPEETAWAVRDSIAERKFITEVSLVLLAEVCIPVSKIPERPGQGPEGNETKQLGNSINSL